MIQELADHAEFDWIRSSLKTPPCVSPGRPILVADLLPPGLAAYAKLLHPIYENPDLVASTDTWDDVPADFDGPEVDATWRQVPWSEIAEQFGVPYGPTLDGGHLPWWRAAGRGQPLRLVGPDEGHIDEDYLPALLTVLDAGPGQTLAYFWWDGVIGLNPEFGDVLCRGLLAQLPEFIKSKDRFSPTYWWPEDRSWCVMTGIDFAFTMVGGSEALVDSLLDLPQSEGFRVDPDAVIQTTPPKRS